jgi:hypothetical protein
LWFIGWRYSPPIPAVMAASILSEKLFHTDAAFPYVSGFWAFLWVVSFFRICAFECPRCGQCFIGSWWFGNFFCSVNVLTVDYREIPQALSVFTSLLSTRLVTKPERFLLG